MLVNALVDRCDALRLLIVLPTAREHPNNLWCVGVEAQLFVRTAAGVAGANSVAPDKLSGDGRRGRNWIRTCETIERWRARQTADGEVLQNMPRRICILIGGGRLAVPNRRVAR